MRRFLLTVLILFSMAAVYAGEGNAELIFLDKRIFRVPDVKSGDVVEKIVGIGRLIQRICWKRGEHHGESVSNRFQC